VLLAIKSSFNRQPDFGWVYGTVLSPFSPLLLAYLTRMLAFTKLITTGVGITLDLFWEYQYSLEEVQRGHAGVVDKLTIMPEQIHNQA
jgi:hypothetical protein